MKTNTSNKPGKKDHLKGKKAVDYLISVRKILLLASIAESTFDKKIHKPRKPFKSYYEAAVHDALSIIDEGEWEND